MSYYVTVEKASDFELVFNESIDSETRNYSIEIGKSYLLVYLAGEINNIIKHDLTNEDFERLKKILDNQFEDK